MPLVGFMEDISILNGIITLPITLGKIPYHNIYMIDFLILDQLGAYNIILGRPFLATTKAIMSMYYLAIKIPIVNEVSLLKGIKIQLKNAIQLILQRVIRLHLKFI